ncbi:MAG: tandem-95 repeat protein, partial [Saprospiraceae bacterium]|nr:tandem-95 repeat protein [Saprospiraceae bacterium]
FSSYVSDIDGDDLILSVSGGVNVTATITDLSVNFTSLENWNGMEILTFTINDQQGRAIDQDDVNIIVTPVNDDPVIILPDSFTFTEDVSLTEDFSSYVSDIDGDDLILSVSGGVNVTATITDLSVNFTSLENWNGMEMLTFTINDQQGRAIDQDAVNIIVTPVNDDPVIILPDSFTFNEDGNLTEDFSSYVSDIDGDDLILSVSGGVNVTATITDLSVNFTSLENWNGTESLTFTINDQQGRAIDQDNVDIIVTPVNDAPVIDLPVSFTFAEDESLTEDFSSYVSDIDGDDLILSVSGGINVTATITVLSVNFTSLGNWNGTESFTFTINDQQGRSIDQDNVDIIVTPVNDAPVIDLPVSFTFAEDGSLMEDFSSYVSDIDGDDLILSVSGGVNVTATITVLSVNFTSAENWNGTELLTFTIDDQQGRAINQDNVNIFVTPINDDPEIDLPVNFTFAEDGGLIEDFSNFVSDIDGDDLVLSVSGGVNVTATITDLSVNFTSLENWNGTELLTFIINDQQGRAIDHDIVDIIITPVNDPPVNVILPIITGTFTVNDTVEVNNGVWQDIIDNISGFYNLNPSFTYEWQISGDNIEFNPIIPYQISQDLIISEDYANFYIRCKVTCTDNGVPSNYPQSSFVYTEGHLINATIRR